MGKYPLIEPAMRGVHCIVTAHNPVKPPPNNAIPRSVRRTNLEIHFNRKDAIGSELDIYIPSLRLAFELNGIFHYEPIYGQSKLDQVQNNDVSKSKLCHEAQIDLCVIDTSHQKYFKPKTSQIFLDIVVSIVNGRL